MTWSVSPSLGTISATGFYTAPATNLNGQIAQVIATSSADPSKSSSATITLAPQVQISFNSSGLASIFYQGIQFGGGTPKLSWVWGSRTDAHLDPSLLHLEHGLR